MSGQSGERPTCETCRHFVPQFRSPAAPMGTCQRFPPNNTGGGFGGWPRVASKEWCGEHSRLFVLPEPKPVEATRLGG